MSKRAVLYARVSSDDRAKTGGGNLRDQLRLCRDYAEGKGYQVVAELAEDDRGASGATIDLPELSKALEMAREGTCEVFIVRELDRLSRDLAKQLIVEQELKRAGVAIEYVLYDFPDTPEGRLNKNLRAMLAEYEREKITQRLMRGKNRTAKEGQAMMGGHPPLGYRLVSQDGKRVLKTDSEEADVVRLIFRLYIGGMGMQAIASYLTEMGVPTWADRRGMSWRRTRNPEGTWLFGTIGLILKNETYIGNWKYNKTGGGEVITIEVPAIISQADFDLVQNLRQRRRTRSKRNTRHEYLLQSRIRCLDCKRSMRTVVRRNPKNGCKRLYYTCSYTNHDCDNKRYYRSNSEDGVDVIAWNWVKKLLENPDQLQQSLEDYQREKETLTRPYRERLQAIDDLLSANRIKLNRLLDLYLSGEFEKDALSERKARLENERDKLQGEKAHLETQIEGEELSEERLSSILGFANRIRAGLTSADVDFEKRRALIDALDVTADLGTEDGQRVLYLHCIIGDGVSSDTTACSRPIAARRSMTSWSVRGVCCRVPRRSSTTATTWPSSRR